MESVITAVAALITGASSEVTQFFTPMITFKMAPVFPKPGTPNDEKALQVLNCFYGHVGGAAEFFNAMTPDDKKKIVWLGITLAAILRLWSGLKSSKGGKI